MFFFCLVGPIWPTIEFCGVLHVTSAFVADTSRCQFEFLALHVVAVSSWLARTFAFTALKGQCQQLEKAFLSDVS